MLFKKNEKCDYVVKVLSNKEEIIDTELLEIPNTSQGNEEWKKIELDKLYAPKNGRKIRTKTFKHRITAKQFKERIEQWKLSKALKKFQSLKHS
jgi:hypothetical protein